ncbi:hypothetical protein Sango_2320900 [Sesamum angolense]|uniref:Uncharacterized protein n=1 Tax=Sesamum angolense TaxID=2727404 RepID=A0AAE2BLK0_9LAMI|nr:hypothetical protein Sango_2320900 [Sesamum angolense]
MRPIMDLDQNGFDLSKPSIHNNMVRKLPLPNCGLTSRSIFGIEKSRTIVVNEEACSLFPCLISRGAQRLKCNSIDGLGLTPSNMIRLESLGSCEEVRQKILGISWNENGPLENAIPETPLESGGLSMDDDLSIMLRMKEVYAVPDRYIRYATRKAFFRTKMAEGSSVQSHGVKMLSLVEKLEDLKAGLDNDTYIDMILQSLPPPYNPFIINYKMNELEKSIYELINMLVQYKETTHESASAILVGEASTSKAKGKGVGRWKRKKG